MSNDQDTGKSLFARLRKREKRARSTGEALASLFACLGGQERGRLNSLWTNWEAVMGDPVASLSHPLGQSGDVLLVGADDAMAMQDLSLLSQEILERANAYLEQPLFTKVTVRLMQGRPDLARRRESPAPAPERPLYTPERVGRHLGSFSPDSPVTRCYEAHARATAQSPPHPSGIRTCNN